MKSHSAEGDYEWRDTHRRRYARVSQNVANCLDITIQYGKQNDIVLIKSRITEQDRWKIEKKQKYNMLVKSWALIADVR